MQVEIFKQLSYYAKDKDGNIYQISDSDIDRCLGDSEYEKSLGHWEGEAKIEEKQVQYTDGSYARAYQEFRYFKIK